MELRLLVPWFDHGTKNAARPSMRVDLERASWVHGLNDGMLFI